MRFSEYFELNASQAELDFVDVPIDTDVLLFVDPYALSVRTEPWFVECTNMVVDYFGLVLTAIRENDDARALALLGRLHEPNQTHLGFSTGLPSGRAIGRRHAFQLYRALSESRAVETGFLSDLADCELVIPGIGPDKISDITTNIIKLKLLSYTQEQCATHGIPTEQVAQSYWHPQSQRWTSNYFPLPVLPVGGQRLAMILVPKIVARLNSAYDSTEYYRMHVLECLQAEHLEAGTALVEVLKNGKRRVTKKLLESEYPMDKDFLFEFSLDHPEVFEQYKRALDLLSLNPISDQDIEGIHPEPHDIDYDRLCRELLNIRPGPDEAHDYHRKILGIMEALFYPELWNFLKEQEINEGRKRIDIRADNNARDGFFMRLNTMHHVQCPYVFFECKNYSTDPGNPELDQLNGRFSELRGRFGFLVCRTIEDRDALLRSCRDMIRDQGSYIIALDDEDVCQMLEMRQAGRRQAIWDHLEGRVRDLVM